MICSKSGYFLCWRNSGLLVNFDWNCCQNLHFDNDKQVGKLSELPWDRLKSITLIPLLFICCKRPCFSGGFKGFSELVRDKLFWRIAHLRPTLSFWMLRDAKLVKGFSWQSESSTMYRCISLYFSATHMQWLQKPSFWSFSQVVSHLIIPVCITVITCGTAFWCDWDLTKYWSFLKLATTYDFSVFHVWQSFKH